MAFHQPGDQPNGKGRCQGGATDPSQVSAGWAYHLRELRTADGPGRHPGGARGLLRVPEPVSHATVHARRTEVLLVRTALRTVLTEENISRVLAEANDPQRYDAARERSLTRQDMQELGKTGAPRPGRRQDYREQRLPGQSHRRDTGPHQESSHLLRPPAAGRQPPGRHAPAGDRPAGRGARLKETVEQPPRGERRREKDSLQSPPGNQFPETGRKFRFRTFMRHTTNNR